MNLDPDVWLSSLLAGVAVGLLSYACRDTLARGFAAVERDLADKLRRLHASSRNLRTYLVVWLVVIGCALFGFGILLDSPVFALPISAFLVVFPWYLLRRLAERRRQQLEDQMADAMVSMAGAVKAGLGLGQGLEILAAQSPRPICDEFHQMVAEYKMGRPLQQTLSEAKERLRSENFTLFATAVMASHESGGRLNETIERIAHSVREMQRLQRKVESETAQARKSAVYMAVAPAFILLVYYFIDPGNTIALFTEPMGQLLLVAAGVLNVVAYLWARAILNPDI
jgi:tight adherence protein B